MHPQGTHLSQQQKQRRLAGASQLLFTPAVSTNQKQPPGSVTLSPPQPGTVSWGDPKPGGQFNPREPLAASQCSPSLEKLSSGFYSHTRMGVRVVVHGAPSHPRCSFIGSAGCPLSTHYRPSTGQDRGQQTPSHPQAAPPWGSRRGAGLGGDDQRVGGTAGS